MDHVWNHYVGDASKFHENGKIDESSGEVVKPQSSKIYLSVYHARDNEPIESDIQIIDVERSKLNGSVKANQFLRRRSQPGANPRYGNNRNQRIWIALTRFFKSFY